MFETRTFRRARRTPAETVERMEVEALRRALKAVLWAIGGELSIPRPLLLAADQLELTSDAGGKYCSFRATIRRKEGTLSVFDPTRPTAPVS